MYWFCLRWALDRRRFPAHSLPSRLTTAPHPRATLLVAQLGHSLSDPVSPPRVPAAASAPSVPPPRCQLPVSLAAISS